MMFSFTIFGKKTVSSACVLVLDEIMSQKTPKHNAKQQRLPISSLCCLSGLTDVYKVFKPLGRSP